MIKKHHCLNTSLVGSFLLALSLITASTVSAESLRTPSLFSSNMVLQSGKEVPVWGWAAAGAEVSVRFAGQSKTATADGDGRWEVRLDPLAANAKNDDIIIAAGDEKLTLSNVLVGEVWVASGQSNMEWTLPRSSMTAEEIKALNEPMIRMITVPKVTSAKPMDDVKAGWLALDAQSAPKSSAVASHFAMKLHKELNVPVGIISTSWGGTRIEPWTPAEGFDLVPELKNLADEVRANTSGEAVAVKNQTPGALYNAMVHPFVGCAIRGAIWYQGESNMGEGMLYEKKMQALIGGWRSVWGQGDFPFYHVQLAPFGRYSGEKLGGIWEAQYQSIKSIKNTGMAVTTDIGNLKDIHPKNKHDVGHRLALWALAKDYGKDIPYSGPLYKGFEVKDNKIVISFDHAEGGLAFKGEKITDVYIMGEGDAEFVPGLAAIEGGALVVTHPDGKTPLHVRMGWNVGAQPNLMNQHGLPASPFRTDRAE